MCKQNLCINPSIHINSIVVVVGAKRGSLKIAELDIFASEKKKFCLRN